MKLKRKGILFITFAMTVTLAACNNPRQKSSSDSTENNTIKTENNMTTTTTNKTITFNRADF